MLNEVVTQRQLFAQLKVDEMAEVVSRPFHLSQLRHAGENNDNYPGIIQMSFIRQMKCNIIKHKVKDLSVAITKIILFIPSYRMCETISFLHDPYQPNSNQVFSRHFLNLYNMTVNIQTTS